jgi:hypothetical protein
MGGGGKVGIQRRRSEGENKRGGGVEGLKPMCEGDGGVPNGPKWHSPIGSCSRVPKTLDFQR